MRKAEIRVERVDSFFERGRRLAKAADRGDAIPSSRVVAYEETEARQERSDPRCPGFGAFRGASSH
jgi:hypothetical protein